MVGEQSGGQTSYKTFPRGLSGWITGFTDVKSLQITAYMMRLDLLTVNSRKSSLKLFKDPKELI